MRLGRPATAVNSTGGPSVYRPGMPKEPAQRATPSWMPRPTRLNALAVVATLVATFSGQGTTPVLAASTPNRVAGHASQVALRTADPAYQPRPKSGRSYVAPTPKTIAPTNSLGAEKLNLRTQTSRTFASGARQLTTLIYGDPVNYRDPSGTWQAIDNNLVATHLAHYAFTNKANRYVASLPADIGSAPIRVELGSAWLTLSLQGARGSGAVSGSTATYSHVLPGVDVVVA